MDPTRELPTLKLRLKEMGYRRGTAPVPEKRVDPTLSLETSPRPGQVVTPGQVRRPPLPLSVRLRNLRSGGRWTVSGAVVLLACWGLWAAESGAEQIANAGLVLLLILGVALGLFGVARLLGSVVLERLMGRTRRSAVLSHLAIGLFLAFAGFSLLRQVEWVITAWNQIFGAR